MQVLRRVSEPKQATGHSYNILQLPRAHPASAADSGEPGARGARLLNVETAPGDGAEGEVTLSVAELAAGDPPLFHANAYLRLAVPQDPGSIVSSQHREERARALPAPYGPVSLRAVAGDVGGVGGYPIYRNATPPDSGYTLCTALFDGLGGRCTLMVQNPLSGDPRTELLLPLA